MVIVKYFLNEQLLSLLIMLFSGSSLRLSWYLKFVENAITIMEPMLRAFHALILRYKNIWGFSETFSQGLYWYKYGYLVE